MSNLWIKDLFWWRKIPYRENTLLFGNTFVHTEYRGYGFQIILRKHIMKKYKNFNYLTRVASKNKYSIKNVRKLGFKKNFGLKFGWTNVSFYYKEI